MKKNFEVDGLVVFLYIAGIIGALIALACPIMMIIGGSIMLGGNTELGFGMAIESGVLVALELFIGTAIILIIGKEVFCRGLFIVACIVAIAIIAVLIMLFVISRESMGIPLIVTGSITLPVAVIATVMWFGNN